MLVKLQPLTDYNSFKGNLDSAALFLGSRKTTYTGVSEIGVAFFKYSNKQIKVETQSINFSSWKLLVHRRFNNTIFSSPENLWN